MSVRNRGGRGKIGLAAALVLAGVLGSAIFWDAYQNERASQIEAQNRADVYSNSARVEVNPICVTRKLSPPECQQEAQNRARPDQRQEFDLEAQRTMAAWTRAMGLAALIGMGVGIFGLGLIYRTWDATREAAENSRKTLRSYIAKERALIAPGQATFSHNSRINMPSGFILQLHNAGPSPAIIERVEWDYMGSKNWPTKFSFYRESIGVIAGEAKGETPHLGAENFRDPMWLIGQVIYRTLESETYISPFCYAATFVDGQGYGPDSWMAVSVGCLGMPNPT